MKSILDQFSVQVMPIVATALGSLLCALVAMATAYFRSKTSNVKIQGALDRLDAVTEDAVKSTQQSVVAAIKPGDDVAKALADAKTAAIDSVKSHYGAKGIEELKKVLGWDGTLLDKNLSIKVESQVHDLKVTQAQVESGAPTATADAKVSA